MTYTRGFKQLRKKLEENPKYIMSCFNCDHYSQEDGDSEEVCQNSSVLKFDMREEYGNIFCIYWRRNGKKEKK